MLMPNLDNRYFISQMESTSQLKKQEIWNDERMTANGNDKLSYFETSPENL